MLPDVVNVANSHNSIAVSIPFQYGIGVSLSVNNLYFVSCLCTTIEQTCFGDFQVQSWEIQSDGPGIKTWLFFRFQRIVSLSRVDST